VVELTVRTGPDSVEDGVVVVAVTETTEVGDVERLADISSVHVVLKTAGVAGSGFRFEQNYVKDSEGEAYLE
jgi:hypothetical protein